MSGNFLKGLAAEWQNFQPEITPCTHLSAEGVRPVFYSGWKNTKVFAWIGLPEGASKEHPVPGMVLVHGGAGTAFSHWVRYWNSRGYAAICMDNCGAMPIQEAPIPSPKSGWPRHRWSGAPGWGAYDQVDWKPEDQWFTHAVSAIIYGHNILRSMPEVQTDNIGITGVSWGAVLTCITAAVDPRFKAASPIYGCGFLCEVKRLGRVPPSGLDWWKNEWDPANFIGDLSMPTFWFAGTNDAAFHATIWDRSIRLVSKAPVYRSMQIRWPHGHGEIGEEMPEIAAFFDKYLKKQGTFIRVGDSTVENGRISAPYFDGEPYAAMLIAFVNEHEEYHALPAEVDTVNKRITAKLPANWKTAYLSAVSEDLKESTSSLSFNHPEAR